MTNNQNPLSSFFRTPKLYISLPSTGRFYDESVIEIPETGEIPILPMTAKDEIMMKNPDALLNGEAVTQVISSCVPIVKNARALISVDVDAILIGIQSATNGDEIDVSGPCPKCKEPITSVASIEDVLSTMKIMESDYITHTTNGLDIEIRPFTYASVVKAGIAGFQSSRSLQNLSEIQDDMEQLKRFNDNFVRVAALNFELLVDSVASIKGTGPDGDPFVVTDRKNILEFMENCDNKVGHAIKEKVDAVNDLGLNKTIQLHCEECDETFEQEMELDPVNFSTDI